MSTSAKISTNGQEGFAVPRFVILIVIIIVGAIAIGVYLLNNPQIFRSRASGVTWINAFEITNSQGQPISCDNSQNPPVCQTNTLTVKIAVKDLSVLTQSVLSEHTKAGESSSPSPSPTPTPIATSTPTPTGSVAPSGGILSIIIGEQEIDFNSTEPVTVILDEGKGAGLISAEYDVDIVVTKEDNSIQAWVIKFNYQPGGGEEATASATPAATASASATPRENSKHDLNNDGILNAFDTASFLQKWRGRNAADLQSIDFNGDGIVNIFDYSTMKDNLSR